MTSLQVDSADSEIMIFSFRLNIFVMSLAGIEEVMEQVTDE